jgi:hypothetical protein
MRAWAGRERDREREKKKKRCLSCLSVYPRRLTTLVHLQPDREHDGGRGRRSRARRRRRAHGDNIRGTQVELCLAEASPVLLVQRSSSLGFVVAYCNHTLCGSR